LRLEDETAKVLALSARVLELESRLKELECSKLSGNAEEEERLKRMIALLENDVKFYAEAEEDMQQRLENAEKVAEQQTLLCQRESNARALAESRLGDADRELERSKKALASLRDQLDAKEAEVLAERTAASFKAAELENMKMTIVSLVRAKVRACF
jgi:hypothetical protein